MKKIILTTALFCACILTAQAQEPTTGAKQGLAGKHTGAKQTANQTVTQTPAVSGLSSTTTKSNTPTQADTKPVNAVAAPATKTGNPKK